MQLTGDNQITHLNYKYRLSKKEKEEQEKQKKQQNKGKKGISGYWVGWKFKQTK